MRDSTPNDDALKSEGDLNISPNRSAWQATHLGEEARRRVEEDAQYFLHQSLSTPCLNAIESASGSSFTDVEGRDYLDFHGNSVHQVGYGHPKVIAAIKEQLDELPFCPRRYTNDTATALAKALVERAPGDLNRVLFAPGGSLAIGMAMKLARAATGRFKTISMWESFHGAGLDAISIGGEAIFRRDMGPLLPGTEHAPPPDARHCPFKCEGTCSLACADYVEYMLEREGDVCAVIAETVRSTPFVPPPDYWKRIRAACDRHGALLILDEIPTALGRTGRMFAFEHYDIVPDMVVIGKGLGGGIMPIAALIVREELNSAMATRALGHYTHEKSPVACAAALATLDVIEEEGLIERSQSLGARAMADLRALQEKHTIIGDVRGIGLLLGIELVEDRTTFARATDAADRIMYNCMSRGLSFKVTQGNILTLTPPLTLSDAEWERALAILDAALQEETNRD